MADRHFDLDFLKRIWALPTSLGLLLGGIACHASPAGSPSGKAVSPDGVEIHFDERGRPKGNPTLVLIHGWSNNRDLWFLGSKWVYLAVTRV